MSETPKKKYFAYQWRFSSELNTSRQHNGPSCSLTMRFPPKRRNKPVLRAFFMGKKEVYSKKCREKVKIKYKWRLFFTNMTLPDNLSPENQQLSPQISQTLFWAWDKGAGLLQDPVQSGGPVFNTPTIDILHTCYTQWGWCSLHITSRNSKSL